MQRQKKDYGSYPRKYLKTASSGVVCNSLFDYIFFLTQNDADQQDLLPLSRRQYMYRSVHEIDVKWSPDDDWVAANLVSRPYFKLFKKYMIE